MKVTADIFALLLTVGVNSAIALLLFLCVRLRARCAQARRSLVEDEQSPASKSSQSLAELPSFPLLQNSFQDHAREAIELNQSEESQLTDRSSLFGAGGSSPTASIDGEDRAIPRIIKERNRVRKSGSFGEKLRFLWKVGDRELAKLASLDSYLYLSFLKCSAYYFLFMTIPSAVLLGIFYTSECKATMNSMLDCLTVYNSFSSDEKMFIVFFAVFCYSLMGYFFIYIYAQRVQTREYFQLETERTGDSEIGSHALMIRGLPEKIRPSNGDNQLFQFFRTKFREDVVSAHVIPTFSELASLLERLQTCRNKLAKIHNQQTPSKYLQIKMCGRDKIVESPFWQKLAHCCCCCVVVKELNAIAYYESIQATLSYKIEQLRLHEPYLNSNSGIGFVSFASEDTASQAYLYVKNYQSSSLAGKGFQESNLDVRGWNVSPAPPPSDIVWNVLIHNQRSYKCCKAAGSTVFLTVLSMVLVIGTIVIDRLNSIKALTGVHYSKQSDLVVFLQAYFTPLLLLVITGIITPLLIFNVDRWEEHELKSDRILNLLRKNFVYAGLNTILLPVIGCALTFSFLSSAQTFREEFILQISRASEFFLRYIIQMTLFLNVALVMGVPYYARKMKRSQKKSLAEPNMYDEIIQGKIRKHFRNWFFEVAHSKVLSISVFSIVQSLQVITPLVVPIGCIFFFVKYVIDKWNIVYVYQTSSGYSPATRQFLLKYSVFSVFTFQFIMAAIFIVSQIQLLIVIGAMIVVFGFLIALIVCRRFATDTSRKRAFRNFSKNRAQNSNDFKMAPTWVSLNNRSARDMYPELQDRLKDAYLHPCEKTRPPPRGPRKKKLRLNYNRDMKQQQPRQQRKMLGSPRVSDVRQRAPPPGSSYFGGNLNRI